MLVGILLFGSLGYMRLEGWSFFESFYMVVITLSTVGFGEIRALSPEGRLFTTILIGGGALAVAYLFGVLSDFIISGELSGRFRRRKVEKTVAKFRGHFIVCGEGRVGRQVGWDLRRQGATCVLIDPQGEESDGEDPEYITIVGDAEDDAVLIRAGVTRARGLVAATGDDPTNMFITMSAKALNKDLVVVARANYVASRAKLRRGGADMVVSPYVLSGQRIASMLTSPTLTDFLDGMTTAKGHGMKIAEFVVPAGSSLAGHEHWAADVAECGVTVLGIRDLQGGEWCTTNVGARTIQTGDSIVAVGHAGQLAAAEHVIGPIDPVMSARFRRQTAGVPAADPEETFVA